MSCRLNPRHPSVSITSLISQQLSQLLLSALLSPHTISLPVPSLTLSASTANLSQDLFACILLTAQLRALHKCTVTVARCSRHHTRV